MSRSIKKTKISGYTKSESEKQDKKIWHKKYRRKQKQNLDFCLSDPDKFIFRHIREETNVWNFDKDGKRWYNKKEAEEYKGIFRK